MAVSIITFEEGERILMLPLYAGSTELDASAFEQFSSGC